MLDAMALVVLTVLVVGAIVIAAALGSLPGKIARKRGHPQVDAISVCGWLGLVTLGILWSVALIWAYTRPTGLAVQPGPKANPPDKRGD